MPLSVSELAEYSHEAAASNYDGMRQHPPQGFGHLQPRPDEAEAGVVARRLNNLSHTMSHLCTGAPAHPEPRPVDVAV